MIRPSVFGLVLAVAIPAHALAGSSSTQLGKAEGQCRANANGPAFIVTPVGLKDRQGRLKLEVYPANDTDFLADDDVLVATGKVFRRVEVPVPPSGPVRLCIRVPQAGPYAVSLLHDRDLDHKFSWTIDGVGFAGNPKLGWSKPKSARATAHAEAGPTPIEIVLNYRSGLGVAPLKADAAVSPRSRA